MTTEARTIRDLGRLAQRSQCVIHPGVVLSVKVTQHKPNVWCSGCQGRPAQTETRQSLTSQYKQGMPIAAAIEPHMRRQHGGRDGMTTNETGIALIDPSDTDIATVAKEWGDVLEGFGAIQNVAIEKYKAAQFAAAGFKPMHFFIIHGKLYMNADGWMFHARRTLGDRFAGVRFEAQPEDSRKPNIDEDGVCTKRAVMYEFNARGQRFPSGEATASAGGPKEQNPVAKADPVTIAEKRARVRVIRATVPLGVAMPAAVDVNEPLDPSEFSALESTGKGADMEQSTYVPEGTVVDASKEQPPVPDGTPIETLDKDHPVWGELLPMMTALDYSPGEEFAFMEWNGPDGALVGFEAIRGLLKVGYSANQVMERVVAADPARQEPPKQDAEQLPWDSTGDGQVPTE